MGSSVGLSAHLWHFLPYTHSTFSHFHFQNLFADLHAFNLNSPEHFYSFTNCYHEIMLKIINKFNTEFQIQECIFVRDYMKMCVVPCGRGLVIIGVCIQIKQHIWNLRYGIKVLRNPKKIWNICSLQDLEASSQKQSSPAGLLTLFVLYVNDPLNPNHHEESIIYAIKYRTVK